MRPLKSRKSKEDDLFMCFHSASQVALNFDAAAGAVSKACTEYGKHGLFSEGSSQGRHSNQVISLQDV